MQRIYSTTVAGVSVLMIGSAAANETDKAVPLYIEPVTTTVSPAAVEPTEKLTPQVRSAPLPTDDDKELRKREAERLKRQYRGVIRDESVN